MLVSFRTPWRSLRLGPLLLLPLLVGALGCSAGSAPERPAASETPAPTAESTPLADYDTTELTLNRAAFCDRVAQAAISAALGGAPSDEQSWRPGDRLPDSNDVGNEFGCSWTTGSATARAWVFAPPMSAERAADATVAARDRVGMKCRSITSAPALGVPGIAQSCELNTGAQLVGISGLVGDAWLSCEISGVSGTEDDDLTRGGDWCVAVLDALRNP